MEKKKVKLRRSSLIFIFLSAFLFFPISKVLSQSEKSSALSKKTKLLLEFDKDPFLHYRQKEKTKKKKSKKSEKSKEENKLEFSVLGIAIVEDKKAVLIEAEGRIFLVEEGGNFSVDGKVFKLKAVQENSITLEFEKNEIKLSL